MGASVTTPEKTEPSQSQPDLTKQPYQIKPEHKTPSQSMPCHADC